MMAWPWLTAAAKTIPWTTLIRRAPEIIEISAQLLTNRKVNQAAKRGTARIQSEADEVLERLKTLEAHDQKNAKVVEQIAEQMQDLTNSVEVLAARVRVLLMVVAVAVVAVGAMVVALL
jgi:hypothetical protein